MDPENYPNPKEFDPSRWEVCIIINIELKILFYSLTIHLFNLMNKYVLCYLYFKNVMQNFKARVGQFLPFGYGSRYCPGSDLSKLEITIYLHHFLLNYRLIHTCYRFTTIDLLKHAKE